jgi:hypothetical protein
MGHQSRKEARLNTVSYCITIEGELDDVSAVAFPDLVVERLDGRTVLHTDAVDQAGLNGVLDRLRMIGAVLVGLERA